MVGGVRGGAMAIATVFALRSANSAAGATSDLYNVQFKGQMTLDEAKQAFLMSNISTMDALLAEDPGEAAEVVAEAEVHQTQARATLADYAATQADPEIRSVIEEALAATDVLLEIRKEVFAYIVAGRTAEGIDLNENGANGKPSGDKTAQAVVDLLNEATVLSQGLAAQVQEDSASSASSAIRNSAILGVVAALVGAGLDEVLLDLCVVVGRLVLAAARDHQGQRHHAEYDGTTHLEALLRGSAATSRRHRTPPTDPAPTARR